MRVFSAVFLCPHYCLSLYSVKFISLNIALFHSGSSTTLMSGSKKSSRSGYLTRICSSVNDNRLRIFLEKLYFWIFYFIICIYCLNGKVNDFHLLFSGKILCFQFFQILLQEQCSFRINCCNIIIYGCFKCSCL